MKKNLELGDMSRTFDPGAIEAKIYTFWESQGFFAPQGDRAKKPFVIATPPPNVTGELHMGHALCYLAQDIVGRWRRMQGRPTLLLPGYDHAGIGLQNVVEKELAAEGLTRHDLGRQAFEERCWDWQTRCAPRIIEQFRRLGFSFDWSRLRFTLDADYARAVRVAFVHYYRRGLIYRGRRVVNYPAASCGASKNCPTARAALHLAGVHDTQYSAESHHSSLHPPPPVRSSHRSRACHPIAASAAWETDETVLWLICSSVSARCETGIAWAALRGIHGHVLPRFPSCL